MTLEGRYGQSARIVASGSDLNARYAGTIAATAVNTIINTGTVTSVTGSAAPTPNS
jgi:hypothetical protein